MSLSLEEREYWRALVLKLRRQGLGNREIAVNAMIKKAGLSYSQVAFLAAGHFRKTQARGSRLASLGGHFVLNFGGKNELAVSPGGRKKF